LNYLGWLTPAPKGRVGDKVLLLLLRCRALWCGKTLCAEEVALRMYRISSICFLFIVAITFMLLATSATVVGDEDGLLQITLPQDLQQAGWTEISITQPVTLEYLRPNFVKSSPIQFVEFENKRIGYPGNPRNRGSYWEFPSVRLYVYQGSMAKEIFFQQERGVAEFKEKSKHMAIQASSEPDEVLFHSPRVLVLAHFDENKRFKEQVESLRDFLKNVIAN